MDYIDLEKYIENIKNLNIIYPINKDQYFLIFELNNKNYINKSYNKLMESNDCYYWTTITKNTLEIKYYKDIFFRF